MTVSIHKICIQFLVESDIQPGADWIAIRKQLIAADSRITDSYITVGNTELRIVEAHLDMDYTDAIGNEIDEVRGVIEWVVEGYGNPKSTLFYCANCDTQTNSIADLTGDRHVGCTEGYGVWFAVDAEKMEMDQQNEQS